MEQSPSWEANILKLLLKSWKYTNRQALIKIWQNWSKQEVSTLRS